MHLPSARFLREPQTALENNKVFSVFKKMRDLAQKRGVTRPALKGDGTRRVCRAGAPASPLWGRNLHYWPQTLLPVLLKVGEGHAEVTAPRGQKPGRGTHRQQRRRAGLQTGEHSLFCVFQETREMLISVCGEQETAERRRPRPAVPLTTSVTRLHWF